MPSTPGCAWRSLSSSHNTPPAPFHRCTLLFRRRFQGFLPRDPAGQWALCSFPLWAPTHSDTQTSLGLDPYWKLFLIPLCHFPQGQSRGEKQKSLLPSCCQRREWSHSRHRIKALRPYLQVWLGIPILPRTASPLRSAAAPVCDGAYLLPDR